SDFMDPPQIPLAVSAVDENGWFDGSSYPRVILSKEDRKRYFPDTHRRSIDKIWKPMDPLDAMGLSAVLLLLIDASVRLLESLLWTFDTAAAKRTYLSIDDSRSLIHTVKNFQDYLAEVPKTSPDIELGSQSGDSGVRGSPQIASTSVARQQLTILLA